MRLRNKKTGEHGEYKVVSAGYLIRVRNCDTNESYQYDCIAGLNENWEDYKPAEPLIKDEKVRKAVRAWAEANNSTKMVFDGYHLASDEHGNDIEFSNSWAENVKHGEWYTIAELCGEEEKCL